LYDKLSRNFWPSLLPADGQFGLIALRFILAGGAAVALAYLSRRYFEEPFLRLKDRFARPERTEPLVKAIGLD